MLTQYKSTMTKPKNERLSVLKLLITNGEFSNQANLLEALLEKGFEVTQATLSRDMKRLKVAKAATMGGKYIYVLPNETMYKRLYNKSAETTEPTGGDIYASVSAQTVVIRTRPGYASVVALDIDEAHLPCVMGTVAGDNTLFVAIREGYSMQYVMESLSQIVQGLRVVR